MKLPFTQTPSQKSNLINGHLEYIDKHNVITAIVGSIWAFAALIVVSLIPSGVTAGFGEASSIVLNVIQAALTIIVTSLLLRRVRAADMGFASAKVPLGRIIIIALVFAVAFNVLYQLVALGVPSLGKASAEVMQGLGFGQNRSKDLAVGMGVALMAPIWEELAFRGLMFRALRDATHNFFENKIWATKAACGVGVVGSSILFAAIHADPNQAVQQPLLFVMGLLAALSYLYTGTILAPILFHSFNNAWVIIKMLYQSGFELTDGLSPLIFASAPFISIAAYYLIGFIYQAMAPRK